jgi:hypothetical protein
MSSPRSQGELMTVFMRLLAALELLLFLKKLREENEANTANQYKVPKKRSTTKQKNAKTRKQ